MGLLGCDTGNQKKYRLISKEIVGDHLDMKIGDDRACQRPVLLSAQWHDSGDPENAVGNLIKNGGLVSKGAHPLGDRPTKVLRHDL